MNNGIGNGGGEEINASIEISFAKTIESMTALDAKVNSTNEKLTTLLTGLKGLGTGLGDELTKAFRALSNIDSNVVVNLDGDKIRVALTEKILKKLQNPTVQIDGDENGQVTIKIERQVATNIRTKIANKIVEDLNARDAENINVSGKVGKLSINVGRLGNLKTQLEEKLADAFNQAHVEFVGGDLMKEEQIKFRGDMHQHFKQLSLRYSNAVEAMKGGLDALIDQITGEAKVQGSTLPKRVRDKVDEAKKDVEQQVTVIKNREKTTRKVEPIKELEPAKWSAVDIQKKEMNYSPTDAKVDRMKKTLFEKINGYLGTIKEAQKTLETTEEMTANDVRTRTEALRRTTDTLLNSLTNYKLNFGSNKDLQAIIEESKTVLEDVRVAMNDRIKTVMEGQASQIKREAEEIMRREIGEGKAQSAPATTSASGETIKIASDNHISILEKKLVHWATHRSDDIVKRMVFHSPATESAAITVTAPVEALSSLELKLSGWAEKHLKARAKDIHISEGQGSFGFDAQEILVNLPTVAVDELESRVRAWVQASLPAMLRRVHVQPYEGGEGKVSVPVSPMQVAELEEQIIGLVSHFIFATAAHTKITNLTNAEGAAREVNIPTSELERLSEAITGTLKVYANKVVQEHTVAKPTLPEGAEFTITLAKTYVNQLQTKVISKIKDLTKEIVQKIEFDPNFKPEATVVSADAEAIEALRSRMMRHVEQAFRSTLDKMSFGELTAGWKPVFPEQALKDLHTVINDYLNDEVNFISDKFRTLARVNTSAGTKIKKEWRGKIEEPELHEYKGDSKFDLKRYKEVYGDASQLVRTTKEKMDKLMDSLPNTRKEFGEVMKDIQKDITEAYQMVGELSARTPSTHTNIQSQMASFKEEIEQLSIRFATMAEKVSRDYFTQEMEKIADIEQLQSQFQRNVPALGVEKMFEKVNGAVKNYFTTVGSILEHLDSHFMLKTKDLSAGARDRIMRSMGLRRQTELPQQISSSQYVDHYVKQTVQDMQRGFMKKMTSSLDFLSKDWKEQIDNYQPKADPEIVKYLQTKFDRLTKAIVKKTQEVIDAQFARLEQEIMEGTVPFTESLKRKQVLRQLGTYGQAAPASNSTVSSVMGGNVPRSSGPTRASFTTGYMPLDPTAPMQQASNGHSMGSTVVRHLHHMVAGSLIGAPLMAGYDAWHNFVGTEDKLADLKNSLNVAVDPDTGKSLPLEEMSARFHELEEASHRLAVGFGKSLEETTAAMVQASKRFKDVENVRTLTSVSLGLSALDETMNPEEYTRGLEAIMTQFHMPDTKDLTRVAGVMTLMSNTLQTSQSDIIRGLTRSGAVMNMSGVNIDEAIMLQALANHANDDRGGSTGNMLKTVTSRLYQPSVQSLLTRISNANPEFANLMPQVYKNGAVTDTDTMTLLRGMSRLVASGDIAHSQVEDFVKRVAGGQQGDKFAATLMQMFERIQQIDAQLANTDPETIYYGQLGKKMNTPQGHLNQLTSQWDVTSFKVLEEFKTGFSQGFDNIRIILEKVGEHSGAVVTALTHIGALATGLAAKFAFDKLTGGFQNMIKQTQIEKLALLEATNQAEALKIAKERTGMQPQIDAYNQMSSAIEKNKALHDMETKKIEHEDKTIERLQKKKHRQGGKLDSIEQDLLDEALKRKEDAVSRRAQLSVDIKDGENALRAVATPDVQQLVNRETALRARTDRQRGVMTGLGISEQEVAKKMEELSKSSAKFRRELAELDKQFNIDTVSTKGFDKSVEELAVAMRDATREEKAMAMAIMNLAEAQQTAVGTTNTLTGATAANAGANIGGGPHAGGGAAGGAPIVAGSFAGDLEATSGGRLSRGARAGQGMAGRAGSMLESAGTWMAGRYGLNRIGRGFSRAGESLSSGQGVANAMSRAGSVLRTGARGAGAIVKPLLIGEAIFGGLNTASHAIANEEDQALTAANDQLDLRKKIEDANKATGWWETMLKWNDVATDYVGQNAKAFLSGDSRLYTSNQEGKSKEQLEKEVADAEVAKGKKLSDEQAQKDIQANKLLMEHGEKGLLGLGQLNSYAQYLGNIANMNVSIAKAKQGIDMFTLSMKGWAQDSPKIREIIKKSADEQIKIYGDVAKKLQDVFDRLRPEQQDDQMGIALKQQIALAQQNVAEAQMQKYKADTEDTLNYIERRLNLMESINTADARIAANKALAMGLDPTNPIVVAAQKGEIDSQIDEKRKALVDYNSELASGKYDGADILDGNGTDTRAYGVDQVFMSSYGSIVTEAAKKYGLDPNLLAAMIYQESSGNPKAQSADGGYGLMQLTSPHLVQKANSMGGVFDPRANIMVGAEYLAEKINSEGSLTGGLTRYNGSFDYVGQVLRHLSKDDVSKLGISTKDLDNDARLNVISKIKNTEADISSLEAGKAQFRMSDLEYAKLQDSLEIAKLRANTQIGIDNLRLRGASEDSMLVRYAKANSLQQQYDMEQGTIAKMQAKLDSGTLSSDDQLKLQADMLGKTAEANNLLVQIRDTLRGSTGSFNMPQGIKVLDYFGYVMNKGKASSYNVRNGNIYVTVAVDRLHANDISEVNTFAQTLARETEKQRALQQFAHQQSLGRSTDASSLRNTTDMGPNVPMFMD